MFERIRTSWRELRSGQPGTRFRDRYYRRKERRSAVTKSVHLVVGTLLTLAGLVMLPAPGPGLLVMGVGAAMLAEESLLVARACDWLERKERALAENIKSRARRRR